MADDSNTDDGNSGGNDTVRLLKLFNEHFRGVLELRSPSENSPAFYSITSAGSQERIAAK